MVSFAAQKLLSLIRSYLFIFAFVSFALGDGFKKILLWFMSKCVLPMFSCRSFIVSGLLGLYSILSLFLCMVLENVLILFFYMLLSNFPSTSYWRDYLFSIVYSCLLCHRLIDHKCGNLFLISLSCSIDLCVCFCASPILFWLMYSLKSGSMIPPALLFFLKIVLAIRGLLYFHTDLHSEVGPNLKLNPGSCANKEKKGKPLPAASGAAD